MCTGENAPLVRTNPFKYPAVSANRPTMLPASLMPLALVTCASGYLIEIDLHDVLP
jgi:hypothetical protein